MGKLDFDALVKRANTLIEALPYIKSFREKTFVIKYGGNAMLDESLKTSVIKDIVLMKYVGINPVIVHGGGPEITKIMNRLGIQSRFVDGHRVTDSETLDVAEMVLVGKLNSEITLLLNQAGAKAVGLSDYRNSLREKSLQQAKKFSYEKMTKQTLESYKKM